MKKLLYFALLLALCVVGCSRKLDSRLVLADSLVETRPDSAYVILCSVNPDSLSGGENRALYSLLMSQAMYKCDVRAKNDSLINIAVDYYKSTDNRANYARSLLFKGAVLYEMGEKEEALRFYKQAESVADTSNYDFIGYVNLRMAEVYTNSHIQNQEHIPKLRKALSNYKKSGNTKYQLSCLSGLSSCFRVHNMDSAYYYMDIMANLARTVGDRVKLYMALATKVRAYESENKDREAIAIGRPVSRFQEKTPLVANVDYDLCRAYAKIGNLDSSLYFFRKLPTENLSDRERLFRLMAETKIALAQKDYKKAYLCKDHSSKLADSIIDRARQMELFETEKRFDKSQVELQNLQLKQERTFWTALFFCVTTVCIVLIVLFVRRRNRLRDYRLLMEQMQNENLSMKNSLMEKLEAPDPMRSGDFEALRAAFQERVDVIRHLVDFSYSRKPEDFIREFNKCVTVNNPGKTFWRDLRCFVDYNFNSLITKIADEYPQLSDTELNFICLMCCNFSNVEIMVCMSYKNERSVCNKRLIIARKMGINMPLERFLRSKIDSENTPKSPM